MSRRSIVLACCAALLGAPGCIERHGPVPAELVGVWGTEAPPYASRVFEITPDSVYFLQGQFSWESFAIRAIEAQGGDAVKRYELIAVSIGGTPQRLRIRLTDGPGGAALRLARPEDVVWKKVSGRKLPWRY